MSGPDGTEKGVARCANCGDVSPIELTSEEVRPIGRQGRACRSDPSYRLLTIDEPSDAFAGD